MWREGKAGKLHEGSTGEKVFRQHGKLATSVERDVQNVRPTDFVAGAGWCCMFLALLRFGGAPCGKIERAICK